MTGVSISPLARWFDLCEEQSASEGKHKREVMLHASSQDRGANSRELVRTQSDSRIDATGLPSGQVARDQREHEQGTGRGRE